MKKKDTKPKYFMTKTQAKTAFQRGLGRGVLAVKEDPERYRELVLWACGRNLSFDTQCEGTRAWYDYQLISCFSDRTEFRDLVINRLREKKPDGGWYHSPISELLMYFAEDGDQAAEAALWEKYEILYSSLKNFHRASWKQRHTVDFFETVSRSLSWKKENYYRIAEDIGGLFLNSDQYDAWDFEWLYDSRPRGFNSELRRKSASSRELSSFFSAFDALKQDEKIRAAAPTEHPIPTEGRALSFYLKRKAPESAPFYAEKYLSAAEPKARAAALEAFSVCPYPLDPSPILSDAESECVQLRTAALDALAKIRDPSVRAFALSHIEEAPDEILPILIRNYTPEDEVFLREWIIGLKIDYDNESGWHSIHLELQDLFDRIPGIVKPPKSLLPIMYESTLCSCCRANIVRQMGKYRMIPGSMWEELLYDSYEDTRTYAAAHFRRYRSSKITHDT